MSPIPRIRIAALAGCIALAQPAWPAQPAPQLVGAGALFPFPLYATWLKQFSREPAVRESFNQTNARVDYDAHDSTAGIADLVAGRVDFAASDLAISDEEMQQVARGVVALPMTAGAVVLAYNLPGVDALRLPRAAYPSIFAGKITRWDDPALAAANPDIELPALAITVVVRADAARATEVLTAHLSAIDTEAQQAIGRSRAPTWPEAEQVIAATGNDGVAARIAQTPGAIGYLDEGYAQLADWKQVALLENKAGDYVAAGRDSCAAALADTAFPDKTLPSGAPDLRAENLDPGGDGAYPIVAMTWMLFYASGYTDEQLAAVQDLIAYCLSDTAQEQAAGLGYVPLPAPIIEHAEKAAGFIQ